MVSKLLLKAGQAVILLVFGDQRLCPQRLSAVLTNEAGFVPGASLKVHFAGPCKSPKQAMLPDTALQQSL